MLGNAGSWARGGPPSEPSSPPQLPNPGTSPPSPDIILTMPIIHGPGAEMPTGEFSAWGKARYPGGSKNVVESHFHDCDEFYMVIEGTMIVRSEGVEHRLGKGDILATRMGAEHEILEVLEDVEFVWLEGELRGLKRRGHLHRGVDVPSPSA